MISLLATSEVPPPLPPWLSLLLFVLVALAIGVPIIVFVIRGWLRADRMRRGRLQSRLHRRENSPPPTQS